MADIALVTAYNDRGELLFGKRRDSGNWTLPGGHLDDGEDPRAGAERELLEETGLEPKSLSFLRTYETGAGHIIHAFSAYVMGTPHSKNDPDDECEEWKFFDVSEGLPPKVANHLQGPPNSDNLVRQLYEAQEVKKAEDEVSRLLAHPDPIERRLALRLNTVGPQHIRTAMLDDNPLVHEAAIDHPAFCDVDGMELLRAPYGSGGGYPLAQQLAFLRRPGAASPEHLGEVIASAPMQPGATKDALFDVAVRHPNLSPDNIADAYGGYALSNDQRLALLQHPNAPPPVLQHALDWGGRVASPEAQAAARAAAAHPNLPIACRDAFVRSVGTGSPAHVHALAADVLRAGAVSPELAQHLFLQNALKQDSPHDALLAAYLQGPTANNEDVTRAIALGGRMMLLGAAGSKALLPHQIDDVVSQVHGSGDHEAMERIMDNPHFGNRHLQVMLSTPVSKSDSHDPGVPRAMDPIEAAGWVSRMKHVFGKAPWAPGRPKWDVLHTALTQGDPEAFQNVKENLDLPTRLARHHAKVKADQAETDRQAYEAQAVELGDHSHKPDHELRKIAGGKDVWAYHGTSSKLLPKILTEGLHGAPVDLDARSSDADVHAARAAHALGGAPAVLRIKHPFDHLREGRLPHQFETDHVPSHHVMEVDGEKVPKNVAKSEPSMQAMAHEPIVHAMAGCQLSERAPFRAAKFLSGGPEVPGDVIRRVLYQSNGNMEAAALRAYGFEVSEKALAALRGTMALADFGKSETEVPAGKSVTAPRPEGHDVAESISRSFAQRFVVPVALDGKHSKGSLLAHDSEGDTTWLLKTGSGGAGPAAGAAEDPSNPNAREAAWYHIAKLWGVDASYPRAELIDIDGRLYAALKLLPWSYRPLEKMREKDPGAAQRILAPYLRDGRLHQWAAMDFILGNPDSHGENVMAEDLATEKPNERRLQSKSAQHATDQRSTPAEVALIDHGSAFAGPEFDPAHDQASFVPYVLRAWAPRETFNQLSVADKLQVMPRVDGSTAEELRAWVSGLDSTSAARLAEGYGINPKPFLDRLAQMQGACATAPADEAVNRLWVTT